jgi:hypothetical protein
MDPRIAQALALLQDCLRRDSAGDRTAAPAGWPSDDWLRSSTDVLTPWYPDVDLSSDIAQSPPPLSAAWDTYFAPPAVAAPAPFPTAANVAALSAARPSTAPDAESVERVMDALYGFVHALGRGDVADAMTHVDADYHAMDGDREITADILRRQLEALVDERRARGFEVALAQVPEPLAHPLGILVKLTIRIDSTDAQGHPESLLLYRVAVFREVAGGHWPLTALGVVD